MKMPAKKTTFLFLAVIVILGFAVFQPSPARAGLLDLFSRIIFGQQKSSQQPSGGRPTLYTEPDHCPPCRQLEKQLNDRYGTEWRKHIIISRGSPSGYIPYITDANGRQIDQSQLFAYLDQAVGRGGSGGQPSPSKPPVRLPSQPQPPDSSSSKPGSTLWTPVRPPAGSSQIWKPAGPALHRLVFDAWLKAVEINPSKLYRKEIKISADGKTLTFQFCELDGDGNEKNCRTVEIKIPNISDREEYKKFVKALEDIFSGGPVPPELAPDRKPPPTPSVSSGATTLVSDDKEEIKKEIEAIRQRIEEKKRQLEQLRQQQGQVFSLLKNIFSIPQTTAPADNVKEQEKDDDRQLKQELAELKKIEAGLDKALAAVKSKQPPSKKEEKPIKITDRGITVARGKQWYTVETDNTVVHAPTLTPDLRRENPDRKKLAEDYARQVEKAVADDCPKEFGCQLPRGSKIEVFLHGSKENYARQSGGSPESPAHTTYRPGAGGGKVEIDINVNHPGIEDRKDAVRHEGTHAFLYKYFPGTSQWAQEGLAVSSESEGRLELHIKRMLAGLRRNNARPHSAEEIMKLKQKVGGYGEPSLLTKYFTEVLGDKAKFLKFLQRANQVGDEQALKDIYGIDMKQLNDGFWKWETNYLKDFNK